MQPNLTLYNDKTPVSLNSDDIIKADKLIRDISHALEFFQVRMRNNPTRNDVHTQIGLAESYLKDLAKIAGYDSVLIQEQEARTKEIRECHTEIRRLEALLGQGITPEAVTEALRKYDSIFRLWYGAHGFQYASLKDYTPFGITYEISDELQYDQDDGCSSLKEHQEKFYGKYSLIATESDECDWDICQDTYHANILDTDKNRRLYENLLRESFPHMRIFGCNCRIADDGVSYNMRVTVNIPYQDLDDLFKIVTGSAKPYYFTFGSSDMFPFRYGWVVVYAKNEPAARKHFQTLFPSRDGSDCLNCAFVYDQETFEKSLMYAAKSPEEKCHGTYIA